MTYSLRVLSVSIVLFVATSATGQRVLLVDATGASGQFRTISAAVTASQNNDLILVRKGTYVEAVVVDNKSVDIMGIEPNQRDVVLQAPVGFVPALTVKNHPAGRVSRFSRFAITGYNNTAAVETVLTSGDLLFDQVEITNYCDFKTHRGILSLSACNVSSRSIVINAHSIQNFFCQDCRFLTSAVNNYLIIAINTTIVSSTAHLSRCILNGSQGGTYLSLVYPGGPALGLFNSTVRVSGLSTDTIRGGNGVTSGMRTSAGASGVYLSGSQLTITGTTVIGGKGMLLGTPYQSPAFQADSSSTVITNSPTMPVIVAQPKGPALKQFSRGAVTQVDVQATPGALSLTWVAVDYQVSQTPWGTALIDLTKPAIVHRLTHNAVGRASFQMDLQPLPATFVGSPYVIQTVALDTANRLSLSGPRLGVLGF